MDSDLSPNPALDLFIDYLEGGHAAVALQPNLGNESFIRFLGLPPLPNSMRCYYIEGNWARMQIRRLIFQLEIVRMSHKSWQVLVPGLLKAAILEHVMLF